MKSNRLHFVWLTLLILPLLHAAIGQFLVYKGLQFQIRAKIQELKSQLSDDKLIVLEFTTDDPELGNLLWIRDDEFRYQRRMYDIVRVETDEDRVRYFCIHDKDEEELLEGLSRSAGYRTRHRDSGFTKGSLWQFHFPVHEYVFNRYFHDFIPGMIEIGVPVAIDADLRTYQSPPNPPPEA